MLRPLWRVGYSQSTINQTVLGLAGAFCEIHYVSFRSQTGKERMEGLGEWCGAPDPGLPSILDVQTPKMLAGQPGRRNLILRRWVLEARLPLGMQPQRRERGTLIKGFQHRKPRDLACPSGEEQAMGAAPLCSG